METQEPRTPARMPWVPVLSFVIVVLACVIAAYEFARVQSNTPVSAEPPTDISAEYKESNFKVIAIATNPFGEQPARAREMLYVIAERGTNDSTCGGMYSSGPCHFFLESDYYNGPNKLAVSEWGGNFAALGEDIAYVDVDTVEFTATGGDGGLSTTQIWHLNVRTGALTKVSEVTTEE